MMVDVTLNDKDLFIYKYDLPNEVDTLSFLKDNRKFVCINRKLNIKDIDSIVSKQKSSCKKGCVLV